MDLTAICRTCQLEWIVDYTGKSKGKNYECPDCERKRLRKKWLNKKKKRSRSANQRAHKQK